MGWRFKWLGCGFTARQGLLYLWAGGKGAVDVSVSIPMFLSL